MTRITRALAVLAVPALLGATGCTAKYEQLLDERDREIVALKDEKARLQVEARNYQAAEGTLSKQMEQLRGENQRLRSDLEKRPTTAKVPDQGVDPDLKRFEKDGLRVERRAEGVALVLPNTITFRSGSAELSSRGQDVLSRLGTTIRDRYAGRTLSIEGHTDNEPIKRSKHGTNWRLSAERAETVRRFLERHGIGKGGVVRVVGYGPTRPVAQNTAPTGREKNRRVELVIMNG